MYKIKKFFQGVKKQGKMVRWPTKKDLVIASAVVLLFTCIAALALSLDDYIITKLLGTLDDTFGYNSSASESAIRVIRSLFMR